MQRMDFSGANATLEPQISPILPLSLTSIAPSPRDELTEPLGALWVN
jgi:hypothetical protein